jgi:hypothetical protein
MAIKELFQDSRPQVLFDPRASQRIDPRFKFTRDGVASYYDKDGVLRYAPANQPRVGFNYEPDENGLMQPVQGLLLEKSGTNLMTYSKKFNTGSWWDTSVNNALTVDAAASPTGAIDASLFASSGGGTGSSFIRKTSYPLSGATYTFSVFAKAANSGIIWVSIYTNGFKYFDLGNGTKSGTGAEIQELANGWYRCSVTATSGPSNMGMGLCDAFGNTNCTLDGSKSVYFYGAQLEESPYATSYIPTAGSTVTRAADLLSIEGTSLPSTGSIYIDARSLTSDVDDTLLSAANASDEKLTLAIRQPASLYNSKALVYEVDGAFKPTLPFPVPSNEQERNLITYGANNYHYRSDSARLTPSSSTSVPANMTRLGIGHDVTDPTKAITGYINTVYLWPGEITPTVAEALVRGDVDPKDADAGVFTPEAGALAFVFNTQGTGTSGNSVVELPVSGSTNNILVDWGDNTSSSFIGAAASSTVSHTYPSAGIYPVQITADDDGTNSGLTGLNFYNSSQRNDLVRVLQWGGSTTWNPTTMYRAFRDCTQLDFENAARINLPDTSAITDWREAFYNCSSISGTFPTFNTTAATTFSATWVGCSSLTAFPFITSNSVTNFSSAWQNCTSLTSFPSINTAAGTNFTFAWYQCSSLTSFPLIDTSSGTNFGNAWRACSSLTDFPLLNTAAGTSFSFAWTSCSSLTSFPLIDTGAGTSFDSAWSGCNSLTSFPLINTTAGTSFNSPWNGCSSLTSFPLINTAAGTNFGGAWQGCSSLTSFPLIDTAAGTNFYQTWYNCNSLTSFPLIDTSSGTDFRSAWNNCNSLTSFPLIDTAAGTNFSNAWQSCSSLTSFPLIDTSSGTNFAFAWFDCSSLTSFPMLDVSSGTNFTLAWEDCSAWTSFPALTMNNATTFERAWRSNANLVAFPANVFDNWTGTPANNCFAGTWLNCSSLTATSVENILNSIDTSGQSAPASGVNITISYNAGSGTPSISTAVTNLKGRGWTITLNGVAQ